MTGLFLSRSGRHAQRETGPGPRQRALDDSAELPASHVVERHDGRLTKCCCSVFVVNIFLFVLVQCGGGRQGLLRHDVQRAAQADAVRSGLHTGHRSYSQGFQTLAPHAGLNQSLISINF